MNCPKCGSLLPDDSLFCQFCGVQLPGTVGPAENAPVIEAAAEAPVDGAEALRNGVSEECVEDAVSETVFPLDSPALKEPAAASGVAGSGPGHADGGEAAAGIKDWAWENPQKAKKARHSGLRLAVILALSLLVLVLLGLNVFQFLHNRPLLDRIPVLESELKTAEAENAAKDAAVSDSQKEIARQEETIAQLQKESAYWESEVSTKNKTISQMRDTIKELQKSSDGGEYKVKAEFYDELCSLLKADKLGYASSNFHSDKSVIVVRKDQRNRRFTLTANWNEGGTVSISYSSARPAAEVDFDNDSWQTSTPMTVFPDHPGVTSVTFSNDVDSKTFSVIIIVTD